MSIIIFSIHGALKVSGKILDSQNRSRLCKYRIVYYPQEGRITETTPVYLYKGSTKR